jgi:hypothetical protein
MPLENQILTSKCALAWRQALILLHTSCHNLCLYTSGHVNTLDVKDYAWDCTVVWWLFQPSLISAVLLVFVGYFMTLSVSRIFSVEWKEEWWIGKNLEGSGSRVTEFVSWYLLGGGLRKSWKKSLKVDVIMAEVRTEDLPHTRPQSDTAILTCSVIIF